MPSSVVAAMKYYSDTSTLRVIFVSGIVYDYKNVPKEVYKAMKAASSKGVFPNTQIKGPDVLIYTFPFFMKPFLFHKALTVSKKNSEN